MYIIIFLVNENFVITSSFNNSINVWDIETEKKTEKKTEKYIKKSCKYYIIFSLIYLKLRSTINKTSYLGIHLTKLSLYLVLLIPILNFGISKWIRVWSLCKGWKVKMIKLISFNSIPKSSINLQPEWETVQLTYGI